MSVWSVGGGDEIGGDGDDGKVRMRSAEGEEVAKVIARAMQYAAGTG